MESPLDNNSTSTDASTISRSNVASAGLVRASGEVSLDGIPVTGASVLAASFDGTDRVSTITDTNGSYTLYIKPGLWYNITASYQGLKHTVWPVNLSDHQTDPYDIALSRTPRSTISGSPAADSEWKGRAVYVEAASLDGSAPLMAVTLDDGSFSLDVRPDIRYHLTGNTYAYTSIKNPVSFSFRNVLYGYSVKLNSNETVLMDYRANRPVPGFEPTLQSHMPVPSGMLPEPMNVSGCVYYEGKPVSGARVEAVSSDYSDRETIITDGTGGFLVNTQPEVQYNLTAYYNGTQHTYRSVSRGTGYDFNLSVVPYSSVAWGRDWGQPGGTMYLEAWPADGSDPVATMTNDSSYSLLLLRPGVEYRLNGISYSPYGDEFSVSLARDTVNLSPNETLPTSYFIFAHHPSKSFRLSSISDGVYTYRVPYTPVPVSGYVYLDGKPLAGATVKAVSIDGDYNGSAVTNGNGFYVIGIYPRTLHEISVSHQGLYHYVFPAFRWELNDSGPFLHNQQFINNYRYDINLTGTPTSAVHGTWTGDRTWNASSYQVEASPRLGGATVTAPIPADRNFTINLRPYTYYNLSIRNLTSGETDNNFKIIYHTGTGQSSYLVYPNETILVDYYQQL
ncbi:carboxypeptidase regulatory-like domain-containing protein [Methanocella sp. MCL-LM]|uniref:carboxypeptidase regulatory-like domain-containing protein n=1 Tax=Methanocella sp. MCL-LM TaxID=3412035 RepID=UPI003C76BB71